MELFQVSDTPTTRQLVELTESLCRTVEQQLPHVENHATLCQLQREIVGYDKLLVAKREFLRMGCVYKHSPKGLQKRMIFLFSDMVVLSCKLGSQFRATRVLATSTTTLRPADLPHSFILQPENDSPILLSASNEYEFSSWWEAIQGVVGERVEGEGEVDTELTEYQHDENEESESLSCVEGGSLSQVCWHRVASVSRDHLHLAVTTQISGYLLRKFKKSHGWQKLWVVFANFALHFYKSWQDLSALASLPLLGYSIGPPNDNDGINKDFVFKLQYKTHVYYFRADSAYSYDRWFEALKTATVNTNN